ncbi:MAG: LysR family transcriptional regulator [Paracoccaceae bacterium]
MRHLQIYSYIRAIVEQGSIRKASETLTISHSALNRQILAFEEDLGTPLFERLSVGVRLSTAGEIYYRRIIEHLAAFEGAKETISVLSGLRFGYISIAVSPELAGIFLAREVTAFRTSYPGIRFALRDTAHDAFSADLEERRADLALMLQPVYAPGIETMATCETALAALVPGINEGDVESRAKAAKPLRSEDLLEHDIILPPEGSGFRERLEIEFRQRNLPITAALETGHVMFPNTAAGRPTLQFWPRMDVDPAWLTRHGALARNLARAPRLRVSLCRIEGRVLSVAAERFAAQLSERLQSWALEDGRG